MIRCLVVLKFYTKENSKLLNCIEGASMVNVLVYKKNINEYVTENWKYEKVHRLILDLNGKIIECSVFEHLDDKKRKVNVSIEISCAYGCPIKCRYCASNLIEKCEFLAPEEMATQVKTAIKCTKIKINTYPLFIVSFSGIGESSLITDRIISAARLILNDYPKVRFYLASLCVRPSIIRKLNASKLPFNSFWVTYVHYDIKKVSKIIPTLGRYDYNFKKIVDELKSFNLCKIKINCVFIKEFNDSDKDVIKLLNILEPIKDKVIIRITRINPTVASCKNKLNVVSSKKLLQIAKIIEKKGFRKHIYFTETNDNFNCGQLIYKYKNPSTTTF